MAESDALICAAVAAFLQVQIHIAVLRSGSLLPLPGQAGFRREHERVHALQRLRQILALCPLQLSLC